MSTAIMFESSLTGRTRTAIRVTDQWPHSLCSRPTEGVCVCVCVCVSVVHARMCISVCVSHMAQFQCLCIVVVLFAFCCCFVFVFFVFPQGSVLDPILEGRMS